MAVRRFDGDDRITLALGSLAFAFAGTLAVIHRPLSDPATPTILRVGSATTGSTRYGLQLAATRLQLRIGSTAISAPTIVAPASAGWQFSAATKASGTVAPRFHHYVFGTEVWTHENGASTVANSGVPTGGAFLGAAPVGDFYPGDIGVAGVDNAPMSDVDIEELVKSIVKWGAAGFVGMWILNQASVATPLTDQVGDADQTAIAGTSVIEEEIPWTDLDVPIQPSGIATGEVVPGPLVISTKTVEPDPILSGEQVGEPLVTARIDPIGIPSAESVGEPLVTARIDPVGIGSGEGVGEPLILGTLAPTGIPSRESIGEVAIFKEASLSWHSVTGTTAGELFRAAYTLTQPGIVTATLTLADGRVLPMSDGNPLEVLLPADTPAGVATITAQINGETYTLGVPLTGTVVVAPDAPRPAPPSGPRPGPRPPRPQRELLTKRATTRLQVRTVTRIRAHVAVMSAVPAWSSRPGRQLRSPIRSVTVLNVEHDRSVVLGRRRSISTLPELQSRVAVRRRDGENVEALILGLLE